MVERVVRLEKIVGKLTIMLVIVFVVNVFLFLLLLRPITFETFRTRRLEIVGKNGRAVIVLSTNPFSQPVIIVHDSTGRRRFGVSLDEQGNAMVAIFDADGKVVASMGR